MTVNAAVGNSAGEATLYVDKRRTGSRVGRTRFYEDTVRVPVTTLDAAIERYGARRYCKIDVKRFEYDHLSLDGVTKALQCLDHI